MIQSSNTIERPRRTRGTPTEDGDFVVFEHVCLFDEHTGEDGVTYDERLLQHIAANCNRRIKNTGDWCPIVVAHTRDREDKAHVNDDPPVIGLAGPFYVGDYRNSEGRQVKAIFATFWIFPDQEQTFLRNPRRSVEIWPEERPEDRYFDPVSVLGAETPKRDLGMIYSRYCLNGPIRYSKRSVGPLRYQEGGAVTSVPGGSNTFIPGMVENKKKPLQHAKGDGGMALSPDDLNQIVEAIKPVIQSMIDSSTPPPDAMDNDVTPPMDNDADDMGSMGGSPPPGMGAGAGAPPPVEPPHPDSMDDESKLYSRGLGRKFMKYRKGDGDWDDDGTDSFMDSLDDDDKKHLGSYMKYMCDDEGAKERYSQRYAKSPIGGTDISDNTGPMAKNEMKTGEPERYGKGATMQYAKIRQERDDAQQKYAKLKGEHDSLKSKYAKQEKELSTLRTAERYSRRFAALKNLEPEYAFDAEEEMGLIENMPDELFEQHVNVIIPQRYSRVSNGLLPTDRERQIELGGDQEKSKRYAKKASDAVQKYRKQGKSVDYAKVLTHIIENNGELDEAALLNGHAH